ncbi:MAG: hypothetical protein K8F92_16660 [Hyphomicrobium sp.]|uniref:hypothetical protein n=1 Tax=Hyphomicrobium sp. TaxID=82 RepID=UPI00132A4943|nr:hypothetical protein [Hyphomicrobium sp.]KAB2938283.1 MAG: hypothetical protein F9K20_19060 [Hyphomicrobium sp.]MBZ0211264.1 hypothetical protein [Hyphomicrobium sp.]
MMKVLEQAIEKIRNLPEERQAAAAEALELIAAQADDAPLSADELEGVKRAQEAVRRGEFASDAKVKKFFGRYRS